MCTGYPSLVGAQIMTDEALGWLLPACSLGPLIVSD